MKMVCVIAELGQYTDLADIIILYMNINRDEHIQTKRENSGIMTKNAWKISFLMFNVL